MNTRELLPKTSDSVNRLLAAATGGLRSIKLGNALRLVGLSILSLGLLSLTTVIHAQTTSSPLTGTWIIEVSFNGATCAPGQIVLFQCDYGLETFHDDGTMAEVDTFASGAKQSWGAGVWKKGDVDQNTGLQQYNITFEQLQFSGGGTASHYDVVWGPVELTDANTFVATGGFASYTFGNSLITLAGYSGTFQATGTRMVLLNGQNPEPLPPPMQ